MTILDRHQILNAPDKRIEPVAVPEWRGTVCVRSMTGRERDAFELATMDGEKMDRRNIRAKLCAAVICDGGGKRLFTMADVEQLGEKSAAALDRVFEMAMELCGLTRKDVEDLEKNCVAAPSGDSTFDSRPTSA